MHYWLVKTEPAAYAFADLQRDKTTAWTGIRNYAARLHLRAMRRGDHVLVYHSMSKEPSIVGLAEVTSPAYQDPTTTNPAWVCVDLKALKPLPRPVTLTQVKQTPALKTMALVRISRLSVQPVSAVEYKTIVHLAKLQ